MTSSASPIPVPRERSARSELQDRPILRSGEVLETVPGVIITQHAGGGKANQYFLRGFNLDHGTDFAIFLDDMPLNLPSHAHGEGYSDMNTVIPEFVQRVNYEKGPYYADVGNYGSAGSAHLEFFKTLPQNFVQVEGGMYGYGALSSACRRSSAPAICCTAAKCITTTAHGTHPDNYYKFNGLADLQPGRRCRRLQHHGPRLSRHVALQRSDRRRTPCPLVGFFGTLNPTDGGNSQRYSLQGEWHHQGANSADKDHGIRVLLRSRSYFPTSPTT